MPLDFKKDSDKVGHQIAMQEQLMTCGPACAYMIECALKRMSMAGGEARISQLQCALTAECADQVSGTTVDGMKALLAVLGAALRNVDMPYGTADHGKKVADWSRISVDTPALILFGWYVKSKGKVVRDGGHFVVAARKSTSSLLVLLDPWFGLAEVQNNGAYTPTAGKFGVLDAVAYTQ